MHNYCFARIVLNPSHHIYFCKSGAISNDNNLRQPHTVHIIAKMRYLALPTTLINGKQPWGRPRRLILSINIRLEPKGFILGAKISFIITIRVYVYSMPKAFGQYLWKRVENQMLVYRYHSLKIDMEHQAEKPAAVLTGTAMAGRVGPPLGTVDIGQSESAYIFRVALPGVHRHDSKFPVLLVYQ